VNRLLPRLLVSFLALAVLCPGLPPAAPGRPATPSRQKLAEACYAKLNALRQGLQTEPAVFTQQEINAYLALNKDRLFQSAAREVKVTLAKDRFMVNASGDLAKANLKLDSLIYKAFLWILKGNHRVEAELFFQSDRRQGKYQVKWLRIDGIRVPDTLAQALARQVGQRQHPPLLPGEPFPLPAQIERCDVKPNLVVCQPRRPASR